MDRDPQPEIEIELEPETNRMSFAASFPTLTAGWIFPDSLAFLTGFAARSTLLLGAGLAAGGMLRLAGCSAATRFRALWLSAAGVPLVLAGSVLADFMEAQAPLRLTMPFLVLPETGDADATEATKTSAIAAAPSEAGAAAVPVVRNAPAEWRPEWLDLPGGVWLAGIGIAVGRVAWRRRRGGPPSSGLVQEGAGRVHRQLRVAADTAGLRVVPCLYFTTDWMMPGMGGGRRRPWIVLPSEAGKDWDEARLRHVLLHECGHIARGDPQADFWAKLALAPLWFHPLTWLLKRRLGALREMACDDWVLTQGKAEPAAYAADLLSLVKCQAAALIQGGPRNAASAVKIPQPLFGMAQHSSAGRRIRRLLRPELRRGEPGRGMMSGLAAGTMALTALSIALVSCGTVDRDKAQPVTFRSGLGEFRQTQSWSPAKPRPGAAELKFCLLEITVKPGEPNFLTPWLPPGGSPEKVGTPLAFDSLRTPAQQKGVDLLTLPYTREGQEVRFSNLRNLHYPVTFDSSGHSKEFEDKELGLSVKATGRKTRDGSAVKADIEWNIVTLTGGLSLPLPSGGNVQQPLFVSQRGSLTSVLIPNGGFTIIDAYDAPLTNVDEALTQEQLTRRRKIKPDRRYLAIGVSSDPLPPAAAGTGPVQPVTFGEKL